MKYLPFRILAGLVIAGPAHAQYDQAQLVRPAEAADLNGHLARLATNPRDVAALIGAGEAALALNDPRAAAGFFARADAIESGNGRIKAGLARVMLQMQNPAEALRLFDQATRLGYPDKGFLSDRALARDLTGDQAGAQRDYQAALKASPDDPEIVRRYAASLGISGQVDAAEKVLEPLLYKSDRAAWRYRAFILAMNNRQTEAKKIADQTMPVQLATAITPYMQKMPYLTAAQKAAAVHFGHFPTTVGARIAAVTPTPPVSTGAPPPAPPPAAAAATPAQAAPPRTERRGRQAETRAERRARLARAATQPAPVATTPAAETTPPAQQSAAATPQGTNVAAAQLSPAQVPQRPTPPQSAPSQPSPSQPVRQAVNEVQGPPTPGFESVDGTAAPASTAPAPTTSQPAVAAQLNAITLARASAPPSTSSSPPPLAPSAPQPAPATVQPLPAQQPPAQQPPAQQQQPNPEATRSLADIIRAIDVPDAERQSTVAAVDLAEVERMQTARRAERQAAADKAKKAAAAKAKAEADAKAKKEAEEKARLAANPSRNWLQIGTGANKSALAFTMRNLRKKYADIAPQDAWTASWGRTNRLLVGPFASFTRAKSLEEKLKADGADAFAWRSDAGEVVERLPGK